MQDGSLYGTSSANINGQNRGRVLFNHEWEGVGKDVRIPWRLMSGRDCVWLDTN